MGANEELKRRMAELNLTQVELAHRMNVVVEHLTGRYGTFQERTVYNLVSGATRRPQGRTRVALEAVFGCKTEELGFTPHPKPEEPVRRRTFLTSTTGTAAAVAVPGTAPRHTVSMSDVRRLRAGLEALVALDDHKGGHTALEDAALAGARTVLDAQHGSASERVDHVGAVARIELAGHGVNPQRHVQDAQRAGFPLRDGRGRIVFEVEL